MTSPNRFAVPLENLDTVRVVLAEQVQAQAAALPPPDTGREQGALDGGGGGCDGDGD